MAVNDTPVHPPLPLGLGSQVTLTGWVGAVAAFITSWVQYGMTPETVTMGATAGGLLAAFFAGRSAQAKSAIDYAKATIDTTEGAYEDASAVDDNPVDPTDTPTPPPIEPA